jgi:hypothetical protein
MLILDIQEFDSDHMGEATAKAQQTLNFYEAQRPNRASHLLGELHHVQELGGSACHQVSDLEAKGESEIQLAGNNC